MKSEEKLQLSLFTRLNTVEAELRAMKDKLAELKVSQDELRRDRDEWRWRAERLLANQENGPLWRWRKRADAAIDAVTAILSGLIVDLRARLAETGLRRNELCQLADAWLRRAGHPAPERGNIEGR
jgi:predicted metal-dependent hydrolase